MKAEITDSSILNGLMETLCHIKNEAQKFFENPMIIEKFNVGELIPDPTLVVLERGGHLGHVEEAEAFARAARRAQELAYRGRLAG